MKKLRLFAIFALLELCLNACCDCFSHRGSFVNTVIPDGDSVLIRTEDGYIYTISSQRKVAKGYLLYHNGKRVIEILDYDSLLLRRKAEEENRPIDDDGLLDQQLLNTMIQMNPNFPF